MKDVLTVFSDLSVPYTLEGGSLLHLFRNCNLGESDLDFVIQLGWLNDTNSQHLHSALKMKGLEKGSVHGVRENLGYEESWTRDGIKECWRMLMFQFNSKTLIFQVDFFTSTFSPHRTQCYLGMWIDGKLKVCSFPLQSIRSDYNYKN